jgi:hypothetical protein
MGKAEGMGHQRIWRRSRKPTVKGGRGGKVQVNERMGGERKEMGSHTPPITQPSEYSALK